MSAAVLPSLPCFPCPHSAACCAHGTTLSDEEADAIRASHGDAMIYQTSEGDWRTRVEQGRCAFLRDNACTLYHESCYPAVCRGFPWVDAETGGPYEFDRRICPEFTLRPELLQINAYIPQDGPPV